MKSLAIFIRKSIDQKIQSLIGKAKATRLYLDKKEWFIQIKMGTEIRDKIPLLFNYGFMGLPSDLGDAYCLFNEGDRGKGHCLNLISKEQSELCQKGDVLLYNQKGSIVHLKKNGEIEIIAERLKIVGSDQINLESDKILLKCSKIEIDAKKMELKGSLKVKEKIKASKVSDSEGDLKKIRQAHKMHTHIDGHGGKTTPPLP